MIANIAVAIAGDMEVDRARVALDARGIDLDPGGRDTARENLGIRCYRAHKLRRPGPPASHPPSPPPPLRVGETGRQTAGGSHR